MIKLVVTDLDGTFLNNKSLYDVELFKTVYAEMQQKESRLSHVQVNNVSVLKNCLTNMAREFGYWVTVLLELKKMAKWLKSLVLIEI